jgi:hypothetical protein
MNIPAQELESSQLYPQHQGCVLAHLAIRRRRCTLLFKLVEGGDIRYRAKQLTSSHTSLRRITYRADLRACLEDTNTDVNIDRHRCQNGDPDNWLAVEKIVEGKDVSGIFHTKYIFQPLNTSRGLELLGRRRNKGRV